MESAAVQPELFLPHQNTCARVRFCYLLLLTHCVEFSSKRPAKSTATGKLFWRIPLDRLAGAHTNDP